MTTMTQARSAYASSSVETASPARLLLMLYDRLVLDVELGGRALEAGDRSTAHEKLVHAQAIVLELRSSLDLSVWPDGKGLASLYSWLTRELMGANVTGDATRVAAVLPIVADLRDTWRQAAVLASVPAQPVGSGG